MRKSMHDLNDFNRRPGKGRRDRWGKGLDRIVSGYRQPLGVLPIAPFPGARRRYDSAPLCGSILHSA
jgi:hypothetical protein